MRVKKLPAAAAYFLTVILFFTAVLISDRTVDVLSQGSILPGNRTVVILDPGHGGEDGGAVSCTGLPESQYNLEIALRLKDLLALLGYPVVMTRTENISVYTQGETLAEKKISDLKERVRLVNGISNGLLLSIHQNQFPESRYFGAQVFYPRGNPGRELAESMQSAFRRSLKPASTRNAKPSQGVYLMDQIRCPGILIECGFLSNPAEESLLRSLAYQQKLCCIMAAETARYLSAA